MRKFIWGLICTLWIISFASCSRQQPSHRQEAFQKWIEANGKVKVLSTTAMINDLVKQVGGSHIDALTLIQGELDPHSYQLVKGDDEKLMFAQLIFYNGLGLEHGPSLHQYLIQNPKAIGLGDLIERQDPSLIILVNGQKDPHIWMDASLWSKAIPLIVRSLSQQDPVHAQEFAANGKRLQEELLDLHKQARQALMQVPSNKRYLVTSHDAFNYFTRAYLAEEGEQSNEEWRKRFAAPEGLAPESQLSAMDIKAIIDYLQQHRISLLFPETNVSRDSIRKIVQACQEHGMAVRIACCPLYGDAMGKPGSEGDTYIKMILYNANTLAEHMAKEVPHAK
ncbi:metal ABC transporter solute-binding protein, Zn/Mn family [Candidatus Protochlamydia phocaeensis]|uniref:metal ABC transporter solute-binding protein, Zn/Mn family n=1 Tax=Candidatus Protochlamydia phocaeensis TaxID=1414722 RepID=UPI000839732C|nr:zinc ABC transporter substrate-binding protein [Candidatus Protochlamydia phocaeensis]